MDPRVQQYIKIGLDDFIVLRFVSLQTDVRGKELDTGEKVSWCVYEYLFGVDIFRYLNFMAAFRIRDTYSSLELNVSVWRYGIALTLMA